MTCGGRSWAGPERGSEILCMLTHGMGSTPPHHHHGGADNDGDDGGADNDGDDGFQIGAGLYAVGRTVQKKERRGRPNRHQSIPVLERGALFNRFFGKPAHGPPHVDGGASDPIRGCMDKSRTDNPDLDLRHVFDRNNRKTDLI